MTFLQIVVFGLASWRFASLLVNEDGPFDMFLRIRRVVGFVYASNGEEVIVPDTYFGGLLSCVWCASFTIALLSYASWVLFPDITTMVATAFAIGAVALMVDKYVSEN